MNLAMVDEDDRAAVGAMGRASVPKGFDAVTDDANRVTLVGVRREAVRDVCRVQQFQLWHAPKFRPL